MKSAKGFLPGPTAGQIMDQYRGGPGFDWVRIGLSLLVITLHSFHVAYAENGPSLATNWSSPIWAATLPAFFAASGFLVAGSAMRTGNVVTFLWFRTLRIAPALVVEVTLCAFILGPVLTSLPLAAYYSDPATYAYMGNIIGLIQYELPGVFLDNPVSGVVNKNLWTLHPEFASYALMAVLMVSRAVYSRRVMTLIWLALSIGYVAAQLAGVKLLDGVFATHVLVYAFVSGIVLYHFRYEIVINRWLCLIAGVCAYALFKSAWPVFGVPFVFYMTVFAGMQVFPRIPVIQNGDYSYGLYLYGYPIQQLVVMVLPAQYLEWWVVLALATVLALGVSMISWRFVEKPTLRLKNLVANPSRAILSQTEPGGLEQGVQLRGRFWTWLQQQAREANRP